jgi:hypothetical protein
MSTITGTITREPFGSGSKSEHNAIYIKNDVVVYKLRRPGANAFQDPVLTQLLGRQVEVRGRLADGIFFADDIKTL